MSQLLQHDAFPLFALCASYLTLLMLGVGHLTGLRRIAVGHATNEEDFAAFNLDDGEVGAPHPEISRYERLHRNHVESTFPFLILGLVYLATDPSSGLASGVFVGFTLLRTVFTVAYVKALQPWRSGSFLLAELFLLVMLLQTAWYGLTNL